MASEIIPSAAISHAPSISPPPTIVRHQFSIAQYHNLIEKGIFAEDEAIELIRGELVKKMVVGTLHAATVNGLTRLLSKQIPDETMLSIQNPIQLGNSELEPDTAILNFREDLYASNRPTAPDVHLLIEVADTSLYYDREIKGPIYAEAGIRDYWIINLNTRTVEVYRDPQADGRFATVSTAQPGETLIPLALNGISLSVEELLGPTKKQPVPLSQPSRDRA